MPGYDVTAHSAAKPSVVFGLLADCTTWPTWSPIDTAEIVDGEEPEGVGTIRVFRTGRNVSRERIVEMAPDRHIGYVIESGALLDYRGDILLSRTVDGGTDIRWRATFRPKTPGTGWFWRLVLTNFMRRCAQGLAAHAESVERTTRRTT
ncbi:SRPBCC family protein [Thermopolyspora sp. NPDC052614]|uniref:SRPBCC family protein n=1 Tax=Thermopolyspora sp. NPDC052614 TaxID=3155682 RepID=UPI0034415280